MSTKIWQVPNKSKAMAKVFARKSGEHQKGKQRKPDVIDWRRELEEELDDTPGGD